jgi:arginyl-tRNA synthetase
LGGAGISLQGVLTGDLDRLLAAEISAARGPADGVTSAGTWRPAPPGSAPGPGTYATPVAFRLAGGDAARAVRIAMTLAAALRRAGWVESATAFGGYLTVTVTSDALAALAVRITEAGPACARGTPLAGRTVPAPPEPELATAADWAQARRQLSDSIVGRLAEAAGAHISRVPGSGALDQGAAVPGNPWQGPRREATSERLLTDENAARGSLGRGGGVGASTAAASPAAPLPGALTSHLAIRDSGPAMVPRREAGPVADALAFAGSWAIIFALASAAPGTAAAPDPCAAAAHHLGNPAYSGSAVPPGLWAAAAHHLGNPAYAVRYAHAHAASALRQAADLGLRLGETAEFGPHLLAHPAERWLLDELSWLPERVAGAARRARPDVLTRYLERLAGAYFDCQEECPAMGPGVRTDGPGAVARLWLAAAAGTALRAGLDLLGVDAPDRL